MKTTWENRPFTACIERVGYTKKIQRKDFLPSGEYPVISQEQEFINGYWNDANDVFRIEKPVVIFGDHTQVLKYIDFDFVLGADGVKILQPKNDLDGRYFYYFIMNANLDRLGYARHYRLLKELTVAYPSLPEQKRIVGVLDEAFGLIAKAKANAEKNLANARELFESYLEGVFANVGETWEKKRVENVTKVVSGFSFKSGDFSPANKRKSIKITNVGVKEFVEQGDGFLPEEYEKLYEKFLVHDGDIVIALTRTIIADGLKVAVVPTSYDGALLNQRVGALIPLENIIRRSFLYYYLCTETVADYVRSNVNTLMQPNLSINDLKNMMVPCPSMQEQQSIVEELDALSGEVKRLEGIYQEKIADLEELRRAVLAKAFNGEI